MLFEDTKYMDYEFPEPQYLGSKFIHRGWISQYIPQNVSFVLDAFAGSQSIAYMFKQRGKTVYTNDFLNFNHQIGLALVENKNQILTQSDLELLFSDNKDPEKYNLIESLYSNLFFDRAEAKFLDSFRSNVQLLENSYKQALAFTVICRSMTRKVTMGHFAHTQAMNYANNPERIKRNRSLVRPIKEIFLDLLPKYNAAVFDNQKENHSFNENVLTLLPKLENVDLVYFDPPYCNSHADYQSFYHLLETFVEYWKDKSFVNGTKRYEPKRYSGFDKNAEVVDNLKKLFEMSQNITHWIISYNDRSFPNIATLVDLIKPFRRTTVKEKEYCAGRGGKGSVAGSREILILCEKY